MIRGRAVTDTNNPPGQAVCQPLGEASGGLGEPV